MALTEYARTDFDTDAKCNPFFYSPAPGGLSNIADVRRVVHEGTSAIEINIGTETPTIEYFGSYPNKTVGQDAYAKMQADTSQPNGTIAYCYSRDSARHGRYVRSGGSWGARTGSVSPKMADDENHRRVAQIRLLLQSYSQANDPYAPPKQGYPDFSQLNVAAGRAANYDMSGWVMRWRMRAIGMSMGRNTKVIQHFQTRVPGMPTIGSANAVPFVNAINQATCISDYWGFGGGGLYAPNAVEYQADSGWVDVDVPLEALWSYWLALGGNDGKMGRLPYSGDLRYVVADPARWVSAWTGNAYLCEAKFNPNPDADLGAIPDAESVRGRLLISSLSWLR